VGAKNIAENKITILISNSFVEVEDN